jgi:RNA polymerase sigma-70 factor, ECF subfamily
MITPQSSWKLEKSARQTAQENGLQKTRCPNVRRFTDPVSRNFPLPVLLGENEDPWVRLLTMAAFTPEPASDSQSDRQAEFVALLTGSHSRLLGYLMSLLGRRHDAEDVLQKASVTMWQKFDTFTLGTDFLAWASTVCFYEAKNFQRLSARAPLCFDDRLLAVLATERLADLGHREERLAALDRCLEKLPEKDRRLLQAAYIDQQGIARLAEQLGRAPQTLYNRLNILRRSLADCVQRRLAEGASVPG